MRFTRNPHKKSCSFKDDWSPPKLTLDVTMLQKAKLTLVTSLKQLNQLFFNASAQFRRINLNNSYNYLFHDRSSSSSSSSSKSSPRSKASSASASNSCFP